MPIPRRRHHNNKGYRQIKNGKTYEQVKAIALSLHLNLSRRLLTLPRPKAPHRKTKVFQSPLDTRNFSSLAMEEITELKELIQNHDYETAVKLAEELEEMARHHIIRGIEKRAVVLLLHLIKRHVERRTTKTWEVRIAISASEIRLRNLKLNRIDNYLSQGELREALEEVFGMALLKSTLTVFRGVLSEEQIAALVDKDALIQQALELIASQRHPES